MFNWSFQTLFSGCVLIFGSGLVDQNSGPVIGNNPFSGGEGREGEFLSGRCMAKVRTQEFVE